MKLVSVPAELVEQLREAITTRDAGKQGVLPVLIAARALVDAVEQPFSETSEPEMSHNTTNSDMSIRSISIVNEADAFSPDCRIEVAPAALVDAVERPSEAELVGDGVTDDTAAMRGRYWTGSRWAKVEDAPAAPPIAQQNCRVCLGYTHPLDEHAPGCPAAPPSEPSVIRANRNGELFFGPDAADQWVTLDGEWWVGSDLTDVRVLWTLAPRASISDEAEAGRGPRMDEARFAELDVNWHESEGAYMVAVIDELLEEISRQNDWPRAARGEEA